MSPSPPTTSRLHACLGHHACCLGLHASGIILRRLPLFALYFRLSRRPGTFEFDPATGRIDRGQVTATAQGRLAQLKTAAKVRRPAERSALHPSRPIAAHPCLLTPLPAPAHLPHPPSHSLHPAPPCFPPKNKRNKRADPGRVHPAVPNHGLCPAGLGAGLPGRQQLERRRQRLAPGAGARCLRLHAVPGAPAGGCRHEGGAWGLRTSAWGSCRRPAGLPCQPSSTNPQPLPSCSASNASPSRRWSRCWWSRCCTGCTCASWCPCPPLRT